MIRPSSPVHFGGHLALVLSVIVVFAPPAQAQEPKPEGANEAGAEAPSTEPPEDLNLQRAREAFRLGSTLARQGQWQDALAAYERSAELRPHPVTTYNIGYVERALGRLTRSRKFLTLALEQGTSTGSEPLPEDLRSVARSYLTELERKIIRASITLADAKTAVSIDGRPLEVLSGAESPLLAAGTAPPGRPATPPSAVFDLLIDPGRHVVLLFLPGKGQTLVEQSFEPGSGPSLHWSIERQPAQTHPARAAPAHARKEPMSAAGPNRTLALSVLGVGAAGFIASGVFAGLALSHKSDLDDTKCPGKVCPPPYHSQEEEMKRFANFATVGLAVGVIGAGAGTYLWFTAKPSRKGPDRGATIEPRIGLGSAGVAGRF